MENVVLYKTYICQTADQNTHFLLYVDMIRGDVCYGREVDPDGTVTTHRRLRSKHNVLSEWGGRLKNAPAIPKTSKSNFSNVLCQHLKERIGALDPKEKKGIYPFLKNIIMIDKESTVGLAQQLKTALQEYCKENTDPKSSLISLITDSFLESIDWDYLAEELHNFLT